MRKAKTRTQIANEYGVSRNTFSEWLKSAGIELPPGLISPRNQDLIYHHFGNPFPIGALLEPRLRETGAPGSAERWPVDWARNLYGK